MAILTDGTTVTPAAPLVLGLGNPHRQTLEPIDTPPVAMEIAPRALLVVSSVFMTQAWEGYPKGRPMAMPVAILSSGGVVLIEYIRSVPARRIDPNVYSADQLKARREARGRVLFMLFSCFCMEKR